MNSIRVITNKNSISWLFSGSSIDNGARAQDGFEDISTRAQTLNPKPYWVLQGFFKAPAGLSRATVRYA